MPVASILVLLLISFVASKLFRSTKMWWAFMSAIFAGLLVGMLSKELVNRNSDKQTPYTQVIKAADNYANTDCMQSLALLVTEEDAICQTGVAGYISEFAESLSDTALIINTTTNGRDSPSIEDDS